MNRIIIIVISLFTVFSLESQSVEQFIEWAKTNNPGLEATRMNYSAAKSKIGQVGDYPDPMVNLGIGVLPVETRLGAQRLRIGVSQQIPWKGLLNARKDLVASKAEVMAYMDEVQEIDIEFAIRTAYSSIIYLEDKRQIVQSKLEILDGLEELAKSSLRSGKGKLSNILMIQRSRESIEADLQLIEKQKEPPTIMINRWAGRNLMEPIEVIDGSVPTLAFERYIEYADKEHPSYRILDQQLEASEKSAALTELERKPKIGVGLEYALIDGRNGVDIAGNGRDVLMPMGSIVIPLHTDRFDAIKQEEKLKQESLKASADEIRQKFTAELYKAASEIEYADMEEAKMESLKQITEETIDLMRSEYATEGTRFEELLRLELELIDFDLNIARARYNKILNQAIFKKYE